LSGNVYASGLRQTSHDDIVVKNQYLIKERILAIKNPKYQAALALVFIGALRVCELLGNQYYGQLALKHANHVHAMHGNDIEKDDYGTIKFRVVVAKKKKQMFRYFYLNKNSPDEWAYDFIDKYIDNNVLSDSDIVIPRNIRKDKAMFIRSLQYACKKYIGCTIHDLRHARIRYLIVGLGIDPLKVCKALEWNDPRLVMHYSNLTELDWQKTFLNSSEKLYNKLKKKELELIKNG
jgi:hypothetical protein